MRLWAILFLAVLAALLAGVLFAGIAAADTPQGVTIEQWYQYVCGNDGAVFKFLANYVMYPAFAIVLASWAANSAWVQKNPVLGPLVRFIAGHWAGWLRDAVNSAAKTASFAFCLALALVLTACAGSAPTAQQQQLIDIGACTAQALANSETQILTQKGNAEGAAATSAVSVGAGMLCMPPPAVVQAPAK